MVSSSSTILPRASPARAHDFAEGERIDFVLRPSDPCASQSVRLTATIKRAFRPFTMSPVYHVSLSPRSTALALGIPAANAVLKFFDRRSLTNAREEYRPSGAAAAYDAAKERAYRAFVSSVRKGAELPLDFDDPWSVHARVTKSDGAFEAYLAYCAEHMFARERGAYARLRSVQGAVVPEAYGAVTCVAAGEIVCGLLLEHIPAASLHGVVSTWTERVPCLPDRSLIQLCDAAVACVRKTAEEGFLDEDVRPDNLLVREGALEAFGSGDVVLVDLADGRVRGEESDAQWAEEVARCDPSGILGRALEQLVDECIGKGMWRYDGARKSVARCDCT